MGVKYVRLEREVYAHSYTHKQHNNEGTLLGAKAKHHLHQSGRVNRAILLFPFVQSVYFVR